MSRYIKVRIEDGDMYAVAIAKGYARQLRKPYPIPGTPVGGGRHAPARKAITLYAVAPRPSATGTEAALEVCDDLDGTDLRLEKGRVYDGVAIPATDFELPPDWFANRR